VPLYDFRCRACQARFEARCGADALAPCPACGSGDTERLPSAFAGPFTVGLRGGEARRSDAARRAREERKREQRARRKDRPDAGR